MESVSDETARKYAIWWYPKALGFSPSERWGHSSCYSHGFVYVFGGCCGGLHFSDVLVLNLEKMAWSTLATSGEGPGPRDSQTAVVVGRKMFVFGGTNGSKKVNDLHLLDLDTNKWVSPECRGTPPSPRESHTTTLVGDDKLIIFGGSGEGESNYLNDLHVFDLKTMSWSSPEVKGDIPVPRDSHSAVAIGNKLFVYGGDRGDRYHGDIDVLDIDSMTWTKLLVHGASPGVRAGHASVNIGTKIYVIGGVGDKQYYNDIWVLDVNRCSWTKVDSRGQQPQGRFSHTAVVIGSDIAIYGGCGEDERPLNQLLVLQLEADHLNSLYPGKNRLPQGTDNNLRSVFLKNKEVTRRETRELGLELASKPTLPFILDYPRLKRKRSINTELQIESEQEEHSHSLSQHSSPSQSDHEQTPAEKVPACVITSQGVRAYKRPTQIPRNHSGEVASSPKVKSNTIQASPKNLQNLNACRNQENCIHVTSTNVQGLTFPVAYNQKQLKMRSTLNMIGSEVRGKVDGAFDSGLLMTATVNGKIFRGVLFAPLPAVEAPIAVTPQTPPPSVHIPIVQSFPNMNHLECAVSLQPRAMYPVPDGNQRFRHAQVPRNNQAARTSTASLAKENKPQNDLQGVVLTLGGPGFG